MFLNKLLEENKDLVVSAIALHQNGDILPDTYVLDLDQIVANGEAMVKKADSLGIDLYFMLKQIGRNPLVAKELLNVGFKGCVAVDYNEALLMIENNIHLCNVGHLVQVPRHALNKIIDFKPDYLTVYTLDIIKEINEVAKKNNIVQKLLVRITDDDARLYSGQIAGFSSDNLKEILDCINSLENVEFGGITVFPALLFDSESKAIKPTDNINGLNRAKTILNDLGYKDYNVNLPSASCCASLDLIRQLGGKSAEPGHSLTGTTPLHAITNQAEKLAYCYVSEISHNYKDKAYCYGGGTYRRGHMDNILVGNNIQTSALDKVQAPDIDSIDYHFELNHNYEVGTTCIMAFRTQIFTTRSMVAVVSKIGNGKPQIVGLYDALGKKIERNW